MPINTDDIEIPLSGGNSSGLVVRIGNTVRKSVRESSTSVHQYIGYWNFLNQRVLKHRLSSWALMVAAEKY